MDQNYAAIKPVQKLFNYCTDCHPQPGSAAELKAFADIQLGLYNQFELFFPDNLASKTIVVVPSLSLDQEVLAKVAALPLSSWNYKSQDATIRHLGPMAQDFHATFGVGEHDRGITTVDADGVALAAIQGLNHKVESDRAKIAELEAGNAELKSRIEKLERLMNEKHGRPR